MESYELSVTITKVEPGVFEWGIVQEFKITDNYTSFEFLAGGQEDTSDEAANRVAEEIKELFKGQNVQTVSDSERLDS